MKLHTDLINLIAEKIQAQTYLEIGVFNPEHNFDKIEVNIKIGVDPDANAGATFVITSDEFFKINALMAGHKFDIIFLDGLHHSDQVKKDIINAWACLDIGGVIVIHDSNPHSEHITHVPRDNREWCGDVYKTVAELTCDTKFTVDFDYGCCVIRKMPGSKLEFRRWLSNTWEHFDANRKELLNLVPVDEAMRIIDAWK